MTTQDPAAIVAEYLEARRVIEAGPQRLASALKTCGEPLAATPNAQHNRPASAGPG